MLSSNLAEWPALAIWTLSAASAVSTAPHSGCAVHVVSRCAEALWKVSASQAEHVRAAVLESALILWPTLHVG